jgi:hypothetical protein
MVTLAELKAIAKPIIAEAKKKRTTYHTTGKKTGKVKEKGYSMIKLTGKKPDIAVQVVREKAFLEGKKAVNVLEEASKLIGQTIKEGVRTKPLTPKEREMTITPSNTIYIIEPKPKAKAKPKAKPTGVTIEKVKERAKVVPYVGKKAIKKI